MRFHKALMPCILGLLAFVLVSGCGKDEVTSNPYDTLAVDYTWKNLEVTTVDGKEIRITTTMLFTDAKTYSRRVQAISEGEIIEAYDESEAGNYVATETEITFTPTGGEPYTVSWRKVPGTGDLELTYADGSQLTLTYEPRQGNEY